MTGNLTSVDALGHVLNAKEVESFLREFVMPSHLSDGRRPEEDVSRWPFRPEEVLTEIKGEWAALGFKDPRDLKSSLVLNYVESADPRLLDLLDGMEALRADTDHMTGFLSKASSGLLTGIAHLYAREMDVPVAQVDIDLSNMKGTNLFFARLREEAGLPADMGAAEGLTDRAARILAQAALKATRDFLAQDDIDLQAPVRAMRSGGDELRLLAVGLPPKHYPKLQQKIDLAIEREIARMGLTDYPHTKDEYRNDPAHNGFGAACAIRDMRDLDACAFSQQSQDIDAEIRANKVRIGQTRLKETGLGRELREMTANAGTGADAPDAATRLAAILAVMDRAEKRLGLTAPAPDPVDPVQSYWGQARGQLPPFSPPDRIREQAAHLYLAETGVPLSVEEEHYVSRVTRGTAPRDPVTETLMSTRLPETLQVFMEDANASEDRAQPWLVGVRFDNLSMYNKAYGTDPTNGMMLHVSTMLKDCLRVCGLDEDQVQLAHSGGLNFQILVPPAMRSQDGGTTPVSEAQISQFREAVIEGVHDLRNTKVQTIFGKTAVGPLFRQVASNRHPGEREGFDVTFAAFQPDGTERRAGELLHKLAQKLDQAETDLQPWRARRTVWQTRADAALGLLPA